MANEILKDILDSTYPLLETFREVAPGTFKHCQNVCNICEYIATELKLNVDLLKASALYHDIGKMWNPLCFSENQETENPHDDLDPSISYHLLTKHVGDSILILSNIDGIPKEMLDIISTHHGDTVLQSIFNKTKNKIEDNFRYKTKKPKTSEAAILMIVDSIEATARSLYNSGKLDDTKSRKNVIDSSIDKLGNDGQLDVVKFGVIRQVKGILIKELEAIYHKRVSYEEEDKNE